MSEEFQRGGVGGAGGGGGGGKGSGQAWSSGHEKKDSGPPSHDYEAEESYVWRLNEKRLLMKDKVSREPQSNWMEKTAALTCQTRCQP